MRIPTVYYLAWPRAWFWGWFRRFQCPLLFALALLLLGAAAGGVMAGRLDGREAQELTAYTTQLLNEIARGEASVSQCAWYRLLPLGLCYLGGFSLYAVFATILVLLVQGYAWGFTLAFIWKQGALPASKVLLLAFLPHNLPFSLALLLAGSTSLAMAWIRWTSPPAALRSWFWRYTGLMGCWACLAVAGTLVEVYLAPWLVKFLLEGKGA
ncbi:stage II sporulation protein M [Desulfothermobacter acidiphilus]|uniref:stage II sporulation protein M n=1 Tax=Desulfothermobacter acidiphilus TaxID=1938353 RepID=UPI003F8B656A